MFYGLGSDGTVGANKNSIKIIGENTDNYAQGYFVYDSKKAGAVTISHLRFGPEADPLASTWSARPISWPATSRSSSSATTCSRTCVPGGTFLLNTPYGPDEIWDQLPADVQEQIIDKKLKFYVIDAYRSPRPPAWARASTRSCRPASSPSPACCRARRPSSRSRTPSRRPTAARARRSCRRTIAAVDQTLANLHEVKVPAQVTSTRELPPPVPADAPKEFAADAGRHHGEPRRRCCRSARSAVDGTFPTGTAQCEKRNIAWKSRSGTEDLHPVRQVLAGLPARRHPRQGLRRRSCLEGAPATFKTTDAKRHGMQGPEVHHPGRARGLHRLLPLRRSLPGQEQDRGQAQGHQHAPAAAPPRQRARQLRLLPGPARVDRTQAQGRPAQGQQQFMQPLFEYSGACAGCGETPYLKLLTQLFGDRVVIANATGCSSIYGGNLPTTPYAKNKDGRGPAWNNSLFEDNAEFGLGLPRLDRQAEASTPASCSRSSRPSWATTWSTRSSTPTRPTRPASTPSASAWPPSSRSWPATPAARPRCCWLSPTTWSGRASGSSAATAGPTTSATAASTTSWPAGATSTCWCWTPRSTPTPAASAPSPRRAAPWPSSPRAASRCARRTWA